MKIKNIVINGYKRFKYRKGMKKARNFCDGALDHCKRRGTIRSYCIKTVHAGDDGEFIVDVALLKPNKSKHEDVAFIIDKEGNLLELRQNMPSKLTFEF